MVTLKNSGVVELDRNSIMTNTYNCEVPQTDGVKPDGGGHAKAVLIPGKNSHPFQERTLTLDQTVKIGRSVARTRPSATNGIFDCKVLSRNHAIIWYDNKKFYIQDTKSSNGTFVNNRRLSKGSEDSTPRELYSGDVVQFGVDVLENQRKGNEDSKSSDESKRIVTHGCIIATVKLFYPNGKEADFSQSSIVPKSDMPQEEMWKLQNIIFEARQREGRLHDKLEELQFIVGKLEVACQDALTNRFEETRLLSKIENLEKQTSVMRKIRQDSVDKTSEKAEVEIHQLLLDVEKVQCASREIQEMQHRKLLETEQKLVEAQTAASNLQLEVFSLREHASRSETHVQELESKCTNFSQTIELLKTNLTAQMVANNELESRLAEIQQREAELKNNFYQQSELMIIAPEKGRIITEECEDDETQKKEKDNQDIVLEWIYKHYSECDKLDDKDQINEDDRTEYLRKLIFSLREALCNGLQNISTCLGQLDSARTEFEKSKDEVERYLSQKEELMAQLESNRRIRLNMKNVEKSNNEMYGEKHEVKGSNMSANHNEKITELESELKDKEEHGFMLECCLQFYKCMAALAKELLKDARQKKNESERKYNLMKRELDSAKVYFELMTQESNNWRKLIESNVGLNSGLIIEQLSEVDARKEKFIISDDERNSPENEGIKDVIMCKECQTIGVVLKTTETNTSRYEGEETVGEESKITEELTGSLDKVTESEDASGKVRRGKDFVDGDAPENSAGEKEERVADESVPTESGDHGLKRMVSGLDVSSSNLGIWEKIEKIQGLSDGLVSDSSPGSDLEIKEIRSLLSLIAEDLVRLLLHEQEMNKEKKNLQEKLDKSMSQADIAALGLAMDLKTILLFSVTAVIAYFIINLFM